jgi:hypothetical protein
LFEKIILNVSSLAILIPLTLAAIRFRQIRQQMPWFLPYLIATFAASLSSQILWWLRINNLFIFHLHTVVEFILISSFYLVQFESDRPKRIFFIMQDCFVVFAFISVIYFQPITVFNSVSRAIEALLIIFMAFSFYNKMLRELKITYLSRSPKFWINTAFFFYYSGSFFLFLLGTAIIDQIPFEVSRLIFSFFGILTIVLYLFFAAGLWNLKTT